ncbi:GAF domain-containing protein [Sulfurimonas sp.]|uniref:GAF domain-containing protein n=1 Tax=Sulfurimonas sp. TaxID=2022749 RepID=UPI00356776FB
MKYAQTYNKLAEFGRKVLEIEVVDEILPYISKYAKDTIGADRCSIFVYDQDKEELWTTLADNVERITVPSDRGLVGYALATKEGLIENNPYKNEHFYKDVDTETGYITKNVIVAPILGSQGEVVGVFQLINKEDEFDIDDAKFMKFFAHYISGFLELAELNEHLDNKK